MCINKYLSHLHAVLHLFIYLNIWTEQENQRNSLIQHPFAGALIAEITSVCECTYVRGYMYAHITFSKAVVRFPFLWSRVG